MQNRKTKKIILSLAAMSVLSAGLHAADWLSIAGTEPSFIKKGGQKIERRLSPWGSSQ